MSLPLLRIAGELVFCFIAVAASLTLLYFGLLHGTGRWQRRVQELITRRLDPEFLRGTNDVAQLGKGIFSLQFVMIVLESIAISAEDMMYSYRDAWNHGDRDDLVHMNLFVGAAIVVFLFAIYRSTRFASLLGQLYMRQEEEKRKRKKSD